MSVLSATGLTRCFGSLTAVDVDLEVERGVVGLLGPNGSGKTTLLRMMATVLSPTSGDLRVFGLDPSRSSERTAIRRRLGYLPQDPGFYRGFSAFDLVDYVAVLKEISERATRTDEVRRVLAAVDLSDVMHKKIHALSGGQHQRVALASALLASPELLVLDEPATGLDPEQRLQLRSILSAHGQSGTVVLSTHHTAEVAAFCQRVIVMTEGRVCFDGTPGELAQLASGRVWIDHDGRAASDKAWITADGTVRAIGDPPSGAELVEPTIDDGYLLAARARSDEMTASTLRTGLPPRSAPRGLGALVAVEARRSLRAPWLWLGIAVSAYSAVSSTTAGWPGDGYMGTMASFSAVSAGLFVLAVLAGSRDHTAAEAPLAPEAAFEGDDRAAARLLGLWPAFAVAVGYAIVVFVVQRLEGGMWIADRGIHANDAVFSPAEMLQAPALFLAAIAGGVAAGRATSQRTIVSIAGALGILLSGIMYWAWQWTPVAWVTAVQVQPIEVSLAPAFDPGDAPADWLLSTPDQYNPRWGRIVVDGAMTSWHTVYLVGLAIALAGLAVRGRRGRRAVAIGALVLVVGIAAQVAVTPAALVGL